MPNSPQAPQAPEPPTSLQVQKLLQEVSNAVRGLGIPDAVFGVVDPQTGAVRVIHTKDIADPMKHGDSTEPGQRRYELRKKIAEKLDLQDPAVVTMGGFGHTFK